MAFNGSGVYTLPGAALANGATVSATEHNQFRDDVATALNLMVTKDGQQTITGNLPMNSKKLTGLAAGTTAGDSVRFEQLPNLAAPGAIGGTTPAAGSFTTLSSTAAGAVSLKVSSSDGTSSALELIRVGAGGDFKLLNSGGVCTLQYGTNDSTYGTTVAQFASGGTIGAGTAAASTGSGITFPATQSASSDANTLDDYREGTWTPTCSNGSTYSGTYIKIGRIVHLFYEAVAGGTISAGSTTLTGLPFSSSGGSSTSGAGTCINASTTTAFGGSQVTGTTLYFTTSFGNATMRGYHCYYTA